jgi:alpha-beta hydrolase superfamily lysophospholipase
MPRITATWFRTPEGLPLFVHRLFPGQAHAVLMIIHGIAEHGANQRPWMEALAAHGIASVAPDLRGHGQSARRMGDIESLALVQADLAALAVETAARHPGLPLFLYGHSMGGLVAAGQLIRNPELWRGAVLSAPALEAQAGTGRFLQILARHVGRFFPALPTIRFKSRALSRNPEVRIANRADPLVYKGRIRARTGAELLGEMAFVKANAARIRLPLLLVHGGEDRIIPPASSAAFAAAVSAAPCTRIEFPGLWHELLSEPEAPLVRRVIMDWLLQQAVVPGG